jgi:O-antigen/teichoic acid export membrane protein
LRVNASVLTLIAVAGGKALAMACTIGAAVVVGRLLGPATLGKWTLLLAAGTLLHTFLVNWTHGATVRYGREEFVRTGTMRRTLTARLPMLVAGAAAATVLLVWQPGGWLERWFAAAPSQAATVALLAASVWIASEAQATLQATDRVVWQALLAPLAGVGSIVAVLVASTLGPLSLDTAAVAFALPSIVIWGVAWFFGLARARARPGPMIRADIWRSAQYGLPMLPAFVIGYFSDWGDHLLLTQMSSLDEVGWFGLAYQFMTAIIAANGMLITVLLPRLIAHEVRQAGYMRTYIESEIPTLYALWMMGTIWCIALVPIIARYMVGTPFDQSVRILLVLLIAVPCSESAGTQWACVAVRHAHDRDRRRRLDSTHPVLRRPGRCSRNRRLLPGVPGCVRLGSTPPVRGPGGSHLDDLGHCRRARGSPGSRRRRRVRTNPVGRIVDDRDDGGDSRHRMH